MSRPTTARNAASGFAVDRALNRLRFEAAGVMAFTRHLGLICKGAGVGFLVGLASIATQDKGVNHVLFVLSKPVEWLAGLAQRVLGLADGSTALLAWLGLGIYWMLLGGLIGWGISVARARLTGEE